MVACRPDLRRALLWWRQVLVLRLSERRAWMEDMEAPAHLFCDASGREHHLGAVLFIAGKCFWTHMATPPHVLEFFMRRDDRQIMGIELLAISLGLSSFAGLLEGHSVVIHSDNTGSEVVFFCFFRLSLLVSLW